MIFARRFALSFGELMAPSLSVLVIADTRYIAKSQRFVSQK